MKKMKCDLCLSEFSAESFDSWMELMKPHYMDHHADFMEKNKDKPKEEGMKWMIEMKSKWDSL